MEILLIKSCARIRMFTLPDYVGANVSCYEIQGLVVNSTYFSEELNTRTNQISSVLCLSP